MNHLENIYYEALLILKKGEDCHPNRYLLPMEIAATHLAIKDAMNSYRRSTLYLVQDIAKEYDSSIIFLNIGQRTIEQVFIAYNIPKIVVPKTEYNNKDFMSLLTIFNDKELMYTFIEDLRGYIPNSDYLDHLLWCRKKFSIA